MARSPVRVKVLTFEAVASRLGVPKEDARFLYQIGMLRARNPFALSEPTFDERAVEQCRIWLAEEGPDFRQVVAARRNRHGAHIVEPQQFVQGDLVGLTADWRGKYSWVKAVRQQLHQDLRDVASVAGMKPLGSAGLLPPELREPTASLLVSPEVINVGIFIGSAAGGWAVGKALDAIARVAKSTAKHSVRSWGGQVPKGFWFVVSIWHETESFWAVIALDLLPKSAIPTGQMIASAYRSIMRSPRKGRDKAVVMIFRGGRLSRRCWKYPSLEEAIRRLGSVTVFSSGGPLESMWLTLHRRSSTGLKVCQTLQQRPGEYQTTEFVALQSGCSVSAARQVMQQLAAIQAPLDYQRDLGWAYRVSAGK